MNGNRNRQGSLPMGIVEIVEVIANGIIANGVANGVTNGFGVWRLLVHDY